MKKKLNILCVLVFVALAVSLSPMLYMVGSAFGQGFEAGIKGYSKEKVEEISSGKAVCLIPDNWLEMDHGTVTNAVNGEETKIWPMQMMAKIKLEKSALHEFADIVMNLAVLALIVVILVAFIKFIMHVNRKEIFTWSNVKLLRLVGWCLLAGTVIEATRQIWNARLISDAFRIKGYMTNYFDYFSVSDIVIGLVALIMAETFAIGLKQKEELELTI